MKSSNTRILSQNRNLRIRVQTLCRFAVPDAGFLDDFWNRIERALQSRISARSRCGKNFQSSCECLLPGIVVKCVYCRFPIIKNNLSMNVEKLIACHECDLLHRIPEQQGRGAVRCRRCGAVLHRSIRNSLDRTLALTVTGLILFSIANAFPLLAFRLQGRETRVTLISGVTDLYQQGMWELSLLVLITTFVVPLLELCILCYVLLPLRINRVPWGLAGVFRLAAGMQPWGMMEVFLIGILVAIVKLGDMAQIVPGLALWSFALLIVILAAAAANLDPQLIWNRVAYRR